MKRLVVALCAFAAFGAPAQAQTIQDIIAKLKVTWNKPTEPFRVIDNIYYVGTEGLASYLIVTPQGNILIDTAMPEGTPLIKANIEKLGHKITDIKFLLNTHAHLDHTGGFAALKAESKAQMVAGAADKPLLEGGYYPGEEKDTSLQFPAVKVDRTVVEGDTVTLGGVTLIAHATPGHSPGCTSWEMKAKDAAGLTHDVLFFCSATVALNRLVGRPTHPGIVEDYRKTFARARDLKPDVFLAPHPEMYGMKEKRAAIREGTPNPFVKDGEFAAYVATLEKDFEAQLAKQTQAAAQKN
jgi:metallo-beta-lactamase class B